jgi:hypothetical protein
MFTWLNSCDVSCNGYLPNGGKLVLNLMSITLHTPWKTLTPFALKDISFVVAPTLETSPWFFRAPIRILIRLFKPFPLVTCSLKMSKNKQHSNGWKPMIGCQL